MWYPRAIISLDEFVMRGGGEGLATARKLDPPAIIERVLASGLRGRGGAGFPTGRKWQTVLENGSAEAPTTVIVNVAEGEPGTFKDRTIVRRNPFLVVEGALIAARAVQADLVVFAMKQSFAGEVERLRAHRRGRRRGLGRRRLDHRLRGPRRVSVRRVGPARDHRRPLAVPPGGPDFSAGD